MRHRTTALSLNGARVFAVALALAVLLAACAPSGGHIVLPPSAPLQEQLDRLASKGFDKMLDKYARWYDLPVTYLYAIASRESECRNVLGDNGNGVGLIQVDVRYHPMAREFRDSGRWVGEPEPLIAYGVALLAEGLRQARAEMPGYSRHVHLHVAASAYNCGPTAVGIARQGGRDPDVCTTGANYAHDVLTRMAIFDELLAANNDRP